LLCGGNRRKEESEGDCAARQHGEIIQIRVIRRGLRRLR
jgi:hypothetical protein